MENVRHQPFARISAVRAMPPLSFGLRSLSLRRTLCASLQSSFLRRVGPVGLRVSGAVAPSAPDTSGSPDSRPVYRSVRDFGWQAPKLTLGQPANSGDQNARCRLMLARLRRENIQQCRVVTHQPIQRDTIQTVIESLGRFLQSRSETTRRDQRACAVCVGETLCQGHRRFHFAKDWTDLDFGRFTRQLEPAIAPALGMDHAHLPQLIDNLCKMVFRGFANLGNFGLGDKPIPMRRTKHEYANCNVGSFGDAHALFQSVYQRYTHYAHLMTY